MTHKTTGVSTTTTTFTGRPVLAAFASSKTLRDIQLPDQLSDAEEVATVGLLLKANRSIQRIGFDNSNLVLNVESVKLLRSAFFGNKKVVFMEPLTKAGEATRQAFRLEIESELRNVAKYKMEIKRIFKSAYSKYNRNWRDGPNRDKVSF